MFNISEFIKKIGIIRVNKNEDPNIINNNTYSNEIAESVFANNHNLLSIEKYLSLKYLKKDDKILIMGCGAGRVPINLYKLGYKNLLGIDYSRTLINAAKRLYPHLLFKLMDIRDLSELKAGNFEAIFIPYNTLDYIYPEQKRDRVFEEVKRLLKPEGIMIYSSGSTICLNPRILILSFIRKLINHKLFSKYSVGYNKYGPIVAYSTNPFDHKFHPKRGFTLLEKPRSLKSNKSNIFNLIYDGSVYYVLKLRKEPNN